jgi:xanthine dehydrogenase accessory factor
MTPLPANLPATLVEWIDAGKPFALVTVLKDAGSTPRKAGTRAIVGAGGEMWGTIGGGLLESEARGKALEAIRTGRPTVFDFKFSGCSARGDDPVCGGTMRVLIDPKPDRHRTALREWSSELAARRRGVVATRVAFGEVHMHWCPDHILVKPIWGEAAEVAVRDARTRGSAQYFREVLSERDEFIEGVADLLPPRPLLLVAGGGHVAQALARQASLLDFDVVVVEDRPEFVEPARFPQGAEVRRGRFAELVGQWPLNRDTYVAIVGRGHKVDGDALAAVIRSDAGYVGMMGSRRKVTLMRRDFLESGLSTAEQFDRIHAPIGLDLGAQTVEEIAASVVAEMVAVRRGRRPPRGR